MGRVKLDLPENFGFKTELSVRIGDINYGNHLGNDSVLSLIHEARLRFLIHHGFSELDIDGFGIAMADSVVMYMSEGMYGDPLTIEVTTDDFNRYGCDFLYRITNKKTGKEVARAKTGVVFFDYGAKKVVQIPEKFKTVMGGASHKNSPS